MRASEMNGGRRASKRARVQRLPGDEQQVSAPVDEDVPVVIQPMNPTAARWLRDGCPGAEFLQQLGLGALSSVNWAELPDPAMASKVGAFLQSYDLNTGEATVDGRVMKLSPETLAELLRLPNQGLKVSLTSRVDFPNRLKFFKPGAYCRGKPRGFDNELAYDPAQARVFSLLSEVVFLSSVASHTGAAILEVISKAREGTAVNWSEFVFRKLSSKLGEVRGKMVKKQPASLPMSVFNWVASFIEASLNYQPSENESDDDVIPVSDIFPAGEPEGELPANRWAKLLSVVSCRVEESVQKLTQKLGEAEQGSGDMKVKLREAEEESELLKVKLQEAEQVSEGLRMKLREAEQDSEDVKMKLGDAEAYVEQLRVVVVDLEKALDASEDRVEEVEKLNKEQEMIIAGLRAEMKGFKCGAKSFQEQLRALGETFYSLTEKLEHSENID